RLPATLSAEYGHSGFKTTATSLSSSASLEIRSTQPDGLARLVVTTLPPDLNVSWASTPGLTTLSLAHDAPGAVSSVLAESSTLVPGSTTPTDYMNANFASVPASVTATFDAAHDEMQYASSTANGAPVATGS